MLEVNGLGTDFDSSYEFIDGDLKLVKNEDNLIQSIINRFNTKLDTLNLFYTDYGSKIYGFLGWVHSDDTLEFIELEIQDVLQQDPRCQENTINVKYQNQKIIAEITIRITDDMDLTFNLVMNENNKISLLTNMNEEENEEEE